MKIFTPVLFALLILSSCGNDDDKVDCTALESELEQPSQDFLAATLAYSTDPSTANCNAFKAAVESLITVSENSRECVPDADLADFDEGLVDLKDELAQIDC